MRMQGTEHQQRGMFSYISAERRVATDHPLRAIRAMVDVALRKMGRQFETMYAKVGRRSIPPEKLLRALLLQVLYTVRSERMLMEQLDYNLLFRWFVGLNIDDPVWDATVFTKNRERLLRAAIAQSFFAEVLAQARRRGLLSTEHFTVDGTLIEAWASHKSFKRKDRGGERPPDDPGNPTIAFHGHHPSNAPHHPPTTPHLACKSTSIIDDRTTRHPGYAISQQKRKRIEEIFGWLKTVAGLRKTRHRGVARVGWMFTFALAAYNLVRMRNLVSAAA